MIDLISRPGSGELDSTLAARSASGDESRIDLHVHSRASGFSTNWWVRGLGLGVETRESYTTPEEVWTLARAAGMDFVTLTDHETLDGAKELWHRPDFVSGIEVNALFPDDETTVDILIYGLSEADHDEIQGRRGNVYALIAYLREAGLVHVLAHPLFDLGGRIGKEQVEKRMVLFSIWEWINGARPAEQNRLAARIAASADGSTLRQLARRHGLTMPPHECIRGTGGSDDHGAVHVGRAWTRFPHFTSVADLLEAMRAGEMAPCGQSGAVNVMAHTAFAIAAKAAGEHPDSIAVPEPFASLREVLPYVPAFSAEQIRRLAAARYEARLAQTFPSGEGGFKPVQTIASIGRLVEGHLVVAPYVAIHGYFGRERRKARGLSQELEPQEGPLRIGVVVDDLDEIHGVATMYRNLERVAAGKSVAHLSLVRCADEGECDPRSPALRAVAALPLPLYPGRSLGVPSLLDILDHFAAADYDVVHLATPGPLGLAALFAATTLGIPVIGAYHTEYAAYARVLSGDHMLGDLVEVLSREFYRRCSVIAAPSRASARALRERGFGDEIAVLPNGVDSALLSPERRSGEVHGRLGQGRTLLLYAGRVSREKGLDWLASGYRALRERRDDVQLVIVGDGPYRPELETALGERATFTGFLTGEELAQTVASCDLFLFPSTTDTLGRAVIEAQASGLPAVVRDAGGASECLIPGNSGFVIPLEDDEGYWSAVEGLIDDANARQKMGAAARQFATQRTWDHVLSGFVALCQRVAEKTDAANRAAVAEPVGVSV
jgi:glycosyltransferase involved in cell wall biosynthesis